MALVTTCGVFWSVSTASADGASITTDRDVYSVGAPVLATGTCPAGAVTAVVQATQSGEVVGQDEADVTVQGAFSVSLDVSDSLESGVAQVEVSCLSYGSSTPVATASTTIYIAPDGDFVPVTVEVSPGSVPIGGVITVSSACPPAASTVEVAAGNADADEPFVTVQDVPGPEGPFETRLRIPSSGAQVGDAVAVVACLSPEGGLVAAGFTTFTVTAAVAVAPQQPAAPELARTGGPAVELTAAAVAMLLLGGAAVAMSRRVGA